MSKQFVSALMTEGLVRKAAALARPGIESLLRASKREGPNFVHMVVPAPFYDPELPYEGILHEETVGPAPADLATWKNDYRGIAHSKAMISRRMKMDTRLVGALYPALFDAGDTHYPGGVYMGGVPVGSSGVEGSIDEAASRLLASTINMLIHLALEAVRDKKQTFL